MQRHVLGGFRGSIPTTEPSQIKGLGKSKKAWACSVLGMDIYKVDGAYIRTQWADFVGGGHGLVYAFIPQREIWVDSSVREWPGYLAAHELLEVLLMDNRDWKYQRAHEAANSLEQELRVAGERGNLSQTIVFDIFLIHLIKHFGANQGSWNAATSIAKQFWKYL